MKTVHLVSKHKWFELIAAGVKCEDYREIKPYYKKLETLKRGDTIIFHKGYSKVIVKAEAIYCWRSFGIGSWGGEPEKVQWVIGFRTYEAYYQH